MPAKNTSTRLLWAALRREHSRGTNLRVWCVCCSTNVYGGQVGASEVEGIRPD